ncbi:MAG: hypothetical protein IPM18_17475 [Phycisphaerales bacterium]|nr:hypothetical protein [Phycisphaerales bacterium]
MRHSRSFGLGGVLLAVLAVVGGCPAPSEPPPEAVLAGEWRLSTVEETGISATYLQFNSAGRLTSVRYEFGATTVEGQLRVASTRVDGQSVRIGVGLFGGGSLNFEGTLSADENTITGQASYIYRILGLTITVDNGAATLTRR